LSEEASREALRRVFPGLTGEAFDAVLRALRWRSVARHELLCRAGEPADGMYLLASGKLLVLPGQGGAPRWVSPGESVGTWALFSDDGSRTADIVAAHASRVGHLERGQFEAISQEHPDFLREVIASMVRYERRKEHQPGPRTTILALVPLDDATAVQALGQALHAALVHLGPCALLMDLPTAPGALDAAVDRLAEAPGHVLLVAPTPSSAAQLIARADHVIFVADADAPPSLRPHERPRTPADHRAGLRTSLLLLHPPGRLRPSGTARWLDLRDVDDHHHVCVDRPADVARAARLLTGRGIGLVLSGGSALGAAHVGVLAALLERGSPIDMLGGTSAGGGIAAVLALHGAYEPTHDAIVEAFFVRNPIGRLSLPWVALTAGGPLDATARRLCGDVEIEDLWLPWFGVSTSLTRGVPVLHRRGPLWRAVRATTSIPGLMPPVLHGDEVLVDGGVLDNFPVGVMRALCGGPVLGCDVLGAWEPRPAARGPLRRWLDRLVGGSDLPDLISTLTRVATLGDRGRSGGQRCDVTFRPDMAAFSVGRFNRFADRARCGYDHAVSVIEGGALDALLPGAGPPALVPPDMALGPARERFGVVRLVR
jgi:NTE family protein